MSAKAFSTPPHTPTIPLRPYEVNVPQADLDDLQVRLALPARHAATWDNTTGPAHLGVRRDWLQQAVERWKTFDWRATEKEINSFPNFIGSVAFEGIKYEIQFLALFSKRKDAVPLMLNHGWPGSILEFVPTLLHVSKTYTPANLPYHVIVPSLVGYGFSSMPPLDRPFGARECAGAFDALMTGLGLGIGSPRGGYIAQGGDIGSFVSRQLATFDGCIGIHLNFFPMIIPTQDKDIMGALDDTDRKALERAALWDRWGRGYFYEHLSKPATIGAVLESSPVAVLAWIGEKLQYADVANNVDWVLANNLDWLLAEISLYWYTNTAATCLWHYRAEYGRENNVARLPQTISKPTGYTQVMFEISPTPISVVKTKANLVFGRRHNEGGHFLALEKPVLLWKDVTDYIDVVVPGLAKM